MSKICPLASKSCDVFVSIDLRAGKSCLFLCLFLLFSFVFFLPQAAANNLQITNAKLVEQDTNADTGKLRFNISWENSWRDATNYDAVWVFAKYCLSACDTTGEWKHAKLKTAGTNPTGTTGGTGTSLDVVVSQDKLGAFLQRSANGTGTITNTSAKLVWDYAASSVTDAQAFGSNTRIRIFGIEMVYIPQGAFYAGDATSNYYGEFTNSDYNLTSTTQPWYIGSENAITTTDGYNYGAAGYFYTNPSDDYYNMGALTGMSPVSDMGDRNSGEIFTIPAAFPKGSQAFYMMKYEISQGQFRDFLNSLTLGQQNDAGLTITGPNNYIKSRSQTGGARSIVGCDYNNNDIYDEADDGEWTPFETTQFLQIFRYLCWAGLRPMTELEYEKAARGTVSAVAGEYAWGSSSYTANAGFSNFRTKDETSNNSANINIWLDNYILCCASRVGMFATSSTNRQSSGASYYGVLDLSGNAMEIVYPVGQYFAEGFAGNHGTGYSSAYEWPSSGDAGVGTRGGSWWLPNIQCSSGTMFEQPVSGRFFAVASPTIWAYQQNNSGYCFGNLPPFYWGGRGVRTASA